MTKPNVVSEAPPGVARNAGVEGVGRRRRTSKRRSRARERKCPAIGPASATGEGVRGTCATSPGAIRRPPILCLLPSGHHACSCASKLLPSGRHVCSCDNDEPTIKLTHGWKAEMNLRTPKLLPGLSEGGGRNFSFFSRKPLDKSGGLCHNIAISVRQL